MTAVIYWDQKAGAIIRRALRKITGREPKGPNEKLRGCMSLKDRKRKLDILWEKYGGRCARCGRPLRPEEAALDHIIPRSVGGGDELENLQLLCQNCNMKKGASISEMEFQRYLAELLCRDGRFRDVRTDVRCRTGDGRRLMFDITFTRLMEGRTVPFVVEVKAVTAVTAHRIDGILQQLASYRQACPDIRFILAVPVVLAEPYRRRIQDAGVTLWDLETLLQGIPDGVVPSTDTPEISGTGAADDGPADSEPDQYDVLLKRLRQCPPGREDWLVYQKLVGDILSALFRPPLGPVSEQNSDGNYANRRDFVLPNYAEKGPWAYLERKYQAELIPVDAKNSAQPIRKNDILQVAHYLKRGGLGLFGLIFSRHGLNQAGERHLQDIWNFDGKMLVVLDDSDVEQMLLLKQSGQDPCQVILEKIQEFRLKI